VVYDGVAAGLPPSVRRHRPPLAFPVSRIRLPTFRALDPGWFVFGGCFVLRLIVLERLTMSESLLPHGSDMAFYNDWARRIAAGQLTDGQAFWGLPGYPYAVALLYRCFGYNTFVPALVQIALDSGTAVLVYKLAARVSAEAQPDPPRRCTLSWVGAGAAAAWALFVPAQAYSVVLMPSAWLTFAFWWLVWQVTKEEHRLSLGGAFLWGLVLGVAATFVATILFLVPVLLGAATFRAAASGAKKAAAMIPGVAVLAGLLVGTAPCWLHNTLVARDPVFLSTHSGVNFWIGNNAEAHGYPHFPAELRAGQTEMLADSVAAAERALGKPRPRSAVSAYWSERAWAYIAAQPGAWLKLVLKKFRNFWSAFQYDDLNIIGRLQDEQVLLPGIGFGLAAALGVPGVCLAAVRHRSARWLLAAVLSLMCAVLTVFVTERYRLAIVPGLLVGSFYGLAALRNFLAQRRYAWAAGYVAVTVATTLGVSAAPTRPELWALEPYASGLRALERGDLARAEQQIERALSFAPQSTEANFALGNIRLQRGDLEGARVRYEEVLRLDSRHVAVRNNLAIVALEQGNFATAERLLREALAIEPNNATRHYLRAHALVGLGDRTAALAAIRQAMQLQPNQPKFESLLRELE
jgi:Flp pilus assembly protein TadD